jgi:hypothetical protein
MRRWITPTVRVRPGARSPKRLSRRWRKLDRKLPIWGSELVVAVALALDLALADTLTIGPNWLLPSTEALLLLGLVMASPRPRVRHSPVRRKIAIGLIAIVSAANIVSLALVNVLG